MSFISYKRIEHCRSRLTQSVQSVPTNTRTYTPVATLVAMVTHPNAVEYHGAALRA